jgi:hypothetical protein
MKDRIRVYVSESKARAAMAEIKPFRDKLPPANQPLEAGLVSEFYDFLADLLVAEYLLTPDKVFLAAGQPTAVTPATPLPVNDRADELEEEDEVIELDDSRLGNDLDF